MKKIDLTPYDFIPRLLASAEASSLCLLDSCGTTHADSHLMIAGLFPTDTFEISNAETFETLRTIDNVLTGDKAAILTLSYDLGRRLERIRTDQPNKNLEPDLFVSLFGSLLVHDYSASETRLAGNSRNFDAIEGLITEMPIDRSHGVPSNQTFVSNFTRDEYLATIETIKEKIRSGETYQTNLTQQITVDLPPSYSTSAIFDRIRSNYPAPFAAYLERKDSIVMSASPERFFRVQGRKIGASPIKGTRPRGTNATDDKRLRSELLKSHKDRAENTMIVDLVRNDLGRVCEYGSVKVRELCSLQELPTLFHLVSTIDGTLRDGVKPSEMIRALFPCGSITGAPKIRTMQIIDELEKCDRGLSMGAIGVYIPEGFGLPPVLDLSVAIRTMVVRDGRATFNVGGGIVIDSDHSAEYEESLIKAEALLRSLGAEREHFKSNVV